MDRDEMLRALAAFAVEGVEYVLIGAAAMGIHGVVRATEDLDIVVRATPENIERLRRALRAATPPSTRSQPRTSSEITLPCATTHRAVISTSTS